MTEMAESPSQLRFLGSEAYNAGLNRQAAAMYRRGAEAALEQSDVRSHVHNLRWTGNALMWFGKFEESFQQLLHAVSYDGHSEAQLEDVYGAMTDLCLLSTRCRPYQVLLPMLAETRVLLVRRGLARWGHRLDLIQAIAHLRRGEFSDAHQLANRAWQQARNACDGPKYQNNSYLHYMFRAAHGLGDAAAMDSALDLFQRHAERSVQMSRVRANICRAHRLAFEGLSESNRDSIDFHVQETLGALTASDSVGDEIIHTLRLLAMLGRWGEAGERLSRVNNAEPAFSTLLQIDLMILQLAARCGWSVPFYARHMAEAIPPQALLSDCESERSEVATLWQQAARAAQTEDARMGCTFHSRAVALRRRWLTGDTGSNEELFSVHPPSAPRTAENQAGIL